MDDRDRLQLIYNVLQNVVADWVSWGRDEFCGDKNRLRGQSCLDAAALDCDWRSGGRLCRSDRIVASPFAGRSATRIFAWRKCIVVIFETVKNGTGTDPNGNRSVDGLSWGNGHPRSAPTRASDAPSASTPSGQDARSPMKSVLILAPRALTYFCGCWLIGLALTFGYNKRRQVTCRV